MTSIQGSFVACGDSYALSFTCTGVHCDILSGYPDTTCNTSGGELSCTNNYECSETATYSSDFTLEEPDRRILRTEEIKIPAFCDEFILYNDGTKAGTNVTAKGSGTCGGKGNSTILPTGTGVTSIPYINSTSVYRPTASGTSTITGGPIQYTGAASSRRTPPRALLWCATLLLFLVFLPTASATVQYESDMAPGFSPIRRNSLERDTHAVAVTSLDLSERDLVARGVLGDLGDIGQTFVDYAKGKIPDDQLAEALTLQAKKLICDWTLNKLVVLGAEWAAGAGAGVALISECQVGLNTLAVALAPEVIAIPGGALLLKFGSGVVCASLVSKIINILSNGATEAYVEEQCSKIPKPCSSDFSSDPNNCGRCGNVCASGKCTDSVCNSEACDGETCETFTTCGPGGSCVCASTSEGSGFCVDGDTSCDTLQTCGSGADCSAGEVCAVATCCEVPVCIGQTFCGNADAPEKMLMRRMWQNATIAHLGKWNV